MFFDAGSTSVFMHLIKPMLNDLFIKQDPKTILWLPIAIVLLFLIRGSATYATDYGMAQIGRGVVQALRSQVFARYLRLPAAYFDREPSGQQISRLVFTVEQVANASTDALKTLILHSLTVLGLTLNMLLTSVRMTG
jgi:subfamily B ATP-binding cassette protein MsbA